jgi:hypothetical protein
MYSIFVPVKLNDSKFYLELASWLIERGVVCKWDDNEYKIVFADEEDAVAFRLKFGL